MGHEKLSDGFLELIRRASTMLPPDVEEAMSRAIELEGEGASAASSLALMLENARQASEGSTPICQDTGALLFFIEYGPDYRQKELEDAARAAAIAATENYYLRPNAVDSVTGKNSGNNLGGMFPYFHFDQRDEPGIRVRLMLKGGGSENVGAQYKLPDGGLKAGRDLEGVRRCVIDAVFNAQGKGCAPGVIGVCIGGDRGTSYLGSKEQLLRDLGDTNPDATLAELETQLFTELNQLGIGPSGFGGKTTVLGVKVGKLHRLPACFFVSVSYVCWAYRKAAMTIEGGEVTYD
ncbi:MAG: fumarate hydratase [Candidatus Eisenbacteria bacterium]|nr:fumarate hydratase [Candidatus Eisenbacteria bacterium]